MNGSIRVAGLALVGLMALAGCGGGTDGGGTGEAPPTGSISGTVGGAASSGVTVVLTGPAYRTALTGAGGGYAFTALPAGSYTVTPARAGLAFAPASAVVALAAGGTARQDFTASPFPPIYAISGTVRGAVVEGVTVRLLGPRNAVATTDASGRYAFPDLHAGSYSVTPALAGHAFTPPSLEVLVTDADVGGQDFTSEAVAPTARCSADGWCWVNPWPKLYSANAVFALSATDAWAVGDGGAIHHWDGVGWTEVASGTTTPLRGVWGASPTDVWAVGGQTLHWDGAAWSKMEDGTVRDLRAVWGSSSSDVWAVGGGVFRWDGSAWRPVTPASDSFFSLWGLAADDVWVGGWQGAYHWDGASWTAYTAGGMGERNAIWGSGPDDVWFAWSSVSSALLHWNGTAMVEVLGGIPGRLLGLSGTAADDAWAVGEAGAVLHWDGSAWSAVAGAPALELRGVHALGGELLVASPGNLLRHSGGSWSAAASGDTAHFFGVWGSAADDVWAVGSGGAIRHFDGSAWAAAASGTTEDLTDVWGLSASQAWAVSWWGSILRWDGARWSVEPRAMSGAEALLGVWGSSASDVWAVGYRLTPGYVEGLVVHYDGTRWSTVRDGASGQFIGVWGSGPNDVWILDDLGYVHRWDGARWTATLPDGRPDLFAIWGSSASDVWFAGSGLVSSRIGSLVLRFDGAAWSTSLALPHPQSYGFGDVAGSGPSDVWAARPGELLHFDGAAWARSAPELIMPIRDLWAASPGDAWAVGMNGTILRYRP